MKKLFQIQLLRMYLTTFFCLLVLASSLNCPISDNQRSTAFSGLLYAEPQLNKISQDMLFTKNYDTAIAQMPQVCLGLSGYQDQNLGYMKIFINKQSVSQQSFVVRISSPPNCRWNKLYANYLVSTKSEIQIGLISAYNPQYDNNGYISLNYRPNIRVSQDIKIRQFIVGIDIAAQNGGALAINHEKTLVDRTNINFIFSSKLCNINALFLSVVIFDPNVPGILFVDGSLQQNSLSTSTQVRIDRTNMEQLRINFVGFSSILARNSSGISISVSFNNNFTLAIDSTDIKSIKINYLIISLVGCGSCTGYPYSYGGSCYNNCPQGTVLKASGCVPIDCRNGYQLSGNNQCIPICGPNSFYSGKICSCISGYNMIGGACNKCPSGTYFNYIQMKCSDICGQNAQYNQTNGRCYCYAGFVLVNNQCTQCSPGTVYDQLSQQCLNQAITCGINQVIVFGKCACANSFYRINGVCQRCPDNSIFNTMLGYCQCTNGYSMNGNICAATCRENEQLVGANCDCRLGFSRNVFGQCVPITCNQNQYLTSDGQCICRVGFSKSPFGQCQPITISCSVYEVLIDRQCVCIPGFSRNPDGICYKIQCNAGQVIDITFGRCVSACASNTIWDANSQRCIPQCTRGYVYNFNYQSCVPACQSTHNWNGSQCVCNVGCPTVCPPGLYYNQIYKACVNYQQCQNNQIWNGVTCVCADGFINIGGICQRSCNINADFINGRCMCRQGYTQINGVCSIINCQPGTKWDPYTQSCVSICGSPKIWNGGSCICPPGSNDFNGACISIPTCNQNQKPINGNCQCVHGFYRMNGICSQCWPGSTWSMIINQCVPINPINCVNGKILSGSVCICPPGTFQIHGGRCSKNCGPNQIPTPNLDCACAQGFITNQNGICVQNCQNGFELVNGNCIQKCGNGEQWSGYNCACLPNYERVAPGFCKPSCGRYERRHRQNCDCVQGYQRNPSGICDQIPINCPYPHTWQQGICLCANGYERSNAGVCIQICQPGYTRNPQGYCVVSCRSDQIYVDGVCKCRPGLSNINGVCSTCPPNSQMSPGGICICTINNMPAVQGSCPAPTCMDPNSDWDAQTKGCRCRNNHHWVYGGCKIPRNCNANEIWTGQDCVCAYGFNRVNGYCQKVNQQCYCPPNSNFNGVSCQCNQGFYPQSNGQCLPCPFNNYWNGRQCVASVGACSSGFVWDQRRQSCYYPNFGCRQNQQWDGVNCRCKQGFFWIDGKCIQCPPATVFDGVQCTLGQINSRCNDPYSYWNGATCVCVPGYWQLAGGCVTCPPLYEWNGICCSSRQGLTRSVSNQNSYSNAVPLRFK